MVRLGEAVGCRGELPALATRSRKSPEDNPKVDMKGHDHSVSSLRAGGDVAHLAEGLPRLLRSRVLTPTLY